MFQIGRQLLELKIREGWENRFAKWREPETATAERKIEAAIRRVKKAIKKSYPHEDPDPWLYIPQGSYHNNTNVREESDVDLCICNQSETVQDTSASQTKPVSYDVFRSMILLLLQEAYGKNNVEDGKKAIHLHKDEEEKVSVDIVPVFTYEPSNGGSTGVAFWAKDGTFITNFPEHHYKNGVEKNEQTNHRYKYVVRCLKSLRQYLPYGLLAPALEPASFLIECLVYNCPDKFFGGPNIYDDIVSVLRFLNSKLISETEGLSDHPTKSWKEVNGIKLLFSDEKQRTQGLDFVQKSLKRLQSHAPTSNA